MQQQQASRHSLAGGCVSQQMLGLRSRASSSET